MSKKNSKAMRRKKWMHAKAKEEADAAKRQAVREIKAVNRVRRASSIVAASSMAEQMAAAAAAVPEDSNGDAVMADTALMPPPSISPACSYAVCVGGTRQQVSKKLPKPVRRMRNAVAGSELLVATFAQGASREAVVEPPTKEFARDRRLSKTELASLRFDAATMRRGPSKAIRKRKGPKAQALVLSRLARAAAKRAGVERMTGLAGA
eukprot:COSAG05_NODE_2847_length_2578_cov_1.912868_1_plen_208_part_00